MDVREHPQRASSLGPEELAEEEIDPWANLNVQETTAENSESFISNPQT